MERQVVSFRVDTVTCQAIDALAELTGHDRSAVARAFFCQGYAALRPLRSDASRRKAVIEAIRASKKKP